MQTVWVQVVSVCGFPEAVSSLPEPGLDEAEAETAEKEKDGGVAMGHYKPVFKEKALVTGGPRPSIKIRPTPNSGKVELTFRGIWRLKHDAEEAKKFYQSINSLVRIIKKSDGYWVYAGRVSHIGNKLGRAGALMIRGR